MNIEMDGITTILGVLCFAHGLFWGILRFIRPRTFNKGYSLAQKLGVEFAFPTQTLYMKKEDEAAASATEMDQQQAFELGQSHARSIVAETTGSGVKPPPVVFPPVS